MVHHWHEAMQVLPKSQYLSSCLYASISHVILMPQPVAYSTQMSPQNTAITYSQTRGPSLIISDGTAALQCIRHNSRANALDSN